MLVTRDKTPETNGTTTEGGLIQTQNIDHTNDILSLPIHTRARPFKANNTPLVKNQFSSFDKTFQERSH
jgi:hypothetical protein